ncbi:hypothetical protein ACMFMG_004798 [Clarireedia jacksonii]
MHSNVLTYLVDMWRWVCPWKYQAGPIKLELGITRRGSMGADLRIEALSHQLGARKSQNCMSMVCKRYNYEKWEELHLEFVFVNGAGDTVCEFSMEIKSL